MTDSNRPVIRTRVAHVEYGDSQFCGYAVRGELVGNSGYWNSISLAVGGPRLTREQEEILDWVATASINADPRVWPLKVARLVSNYGSTLMGITASLISLDGGYVGAPAVEGTAHMFLGLRDLGGDREAIAAEIHRRIDAGERLMGFGVPNRDRDERVLGLLPLVENYNLTSGFYWQLMLAVEAAALAKKASLRLNLAAASSAIYLDIGFSPPQIGMLGTLMLIANMVANASEGAERVEPSLRALPLEFVKYQGPERRQSPRSIKRPQS